MESSIKLPGLKKLLTIAITAAVIIAAAISIIPKLGRPGDATIKDWLEIIESGDEVVIFGNNNPGFIIDGDLGSYVISMDRSKAAIYIEYEDSESGALWFATTTGTYLIANDVNDYILSDSGNGVAYLTGYDEENDTATLYLFDTLSRRKTLISEYVYCSDSYMFGVVISPDGQSVGYIVDFDDVNREYTGYVKIDGRTPERLGDNMLAVAISNSGRYIYYARIDADYNISLYVRSGTDDNRLAADADAIRSAMLNIDYSQILFTISDDGQKTYISRNGAEREKISGPAIRRLVLPEDTQSRRIFFPTRIDIYGISSFSGFVALTGEGLSHYDNRLEPERISNSTSYADSAMISNDGRILYYISNSNRLSSIRFTASGAERKDIDKDVYSFAASADGSSVYYVNGDNELYYAKRNGTPVKIADDVLPRHLALSHSANRAYFIVDYSSDAGGVLYFSDNGGRKEKVPGAFDVVSVDSTPVNVFYETIDDMLYRSNGSERFSLIYEAGNESGGNAANSLRPLTGGSDGLITTTVPAPSPASSPSVTPTATASSAPSASSPGG